MAKVEDQNIPSGQQHLYDGGLEIARPWKDILTVRGRYPWRLPHMQGDGRIHKDWPFGAGVTNKQFEHRKIFRRSCDCYNNQLKTHDIVDPEFGPKSRGYWFDAAGGSGLWYYDYFMRQTINAYIATGAPDWCKKLVTGDSWVELVNPDANYGALKRLYCYDWILFPATHLVAETYVTKNDPLTTIYHFFIDVVLIGMFPVVSGIFLAFYEIADEIDELG
ncbi:unnamed protein product, partial [marine sediment metagenome]